MFFYTFLVLSILEHLVIIILGFQAQTKFILKFTPPTFGKQYKSVLSWSFLSLIPMTKAYPI